MSATLPGFSSWIVSAIILRAPYGVRDNFTRKYYGFDKENKEEHPICLFTFSF